MPKHALLLRACSVTFSAAAFATTLPATAAAISAPTGVLSPGATPGRVAIVWPHTNDATDGFRVYRNGAQIAALDRYAQTYVDATVSPGTTYSYTVASVQGTTLSAPSAAVTVTTPTTPTVITACSSTPKPSGRYVLGANLTASGTTPCITFQNTSNVTLDCADHTIQSTADAQALKVVSVLKLFTTRCNFNLATTDSYKPSVHVVGGGQLLFDSNRFQGSESLPVKQFWAQARTSALYVTRSTFAKAEFVASMTNLTYVGQNSFAGPSTIGVIGPVQLQGSTNGRVVDNTIDGGADAAGTQDLGSDDGVVISNVTNAWVAGNKISNVHDAGIEGYDIVEDSAIEANVIHDAREAGIGHWFSLGFNRNTVFDNSVSRSRRLFWFYSAGIDPPGGRTEWSLTNNWFISNRFSSPTDPTIPAAEFKPDTKPSYSATGNAFIDNDFGKDSATPQFSPSSLVETANTFGNVCTLPNTLLNCS